MRTTRQLARTMATLLAGATIAAGVVTGPMGGVAHALTATDCANRVPQLADTDPVRMDRFEVDLGDGAEVSPYSGRTARKTSNHIPEMPAVVCWKTGRDAVYVLGTVYWDAYVAGGGGIVIQVFDTQGRELRRVAEGIDSATGQFNRRSFDRALEFDAVHGGGTIDRVHLSAVKKQSDGTIKAVGATIALTYGD